MLIHPKTRFEDVYVQKASYSGANWKKPQISKKANSKWNWTNVKFMDESSIAYVSPGVLLMIGNFNELLNIQLRFMFGATSLKKDFQFPIRMHF